MEMKPFLLLKSEASRRTNGLDISLTAALCGSNAARIHEPPS